CIRTPRLPLTSPLSPYTTLFRSWLDQFDYATPSHAGRMFVYVIAPDTPEPLQYIELTPAFPESAWAPFGNIPQVSRLGNRLVAVDRKSTRLNSSHVKISYAVFGL